MRKTTVDSKNDNIIKIVYMMLNHTNGVTYDDIISELKVSRKTAERYVRCIQYNFGEHLIDELQPEYEKQKRWGFVNYYPREFATFSDKEIAVMEVLKSHVTFQKYLPIIESIIEKMRVVRPTKK